MPSPQTSRSDRSKPNGGRRNGAVAKVAAGGGDGPVRKRRDEEVMAAAVKVFYERGYADASVQDVADELGILKGSLYHYIKTKEDLLYRLLVELHDEVESILEEVEAVEGLSPLERLELYVRQQVRFNAEHLPSVAVYYNDVDRLSEQRHQNIIGRRKVHERYVAGLIEQAQKNGEADSSLDAHVLGNCIFGTVIWTYKWYRPGGKIGREKLASVCAEFVLRGVIGVAPKAAKTAKKPRRKTKR